MKNIGYSPNLLESRHAPVWRGIAERRPGKRKDIPNRFSFCSFLPPFHPKRMPPCRHLSSRPTIFLSLVRLQG